MSTELVNLSALGALATVGGLDEDTLAVAGGNRQGNKRISIKGGVFRKYAGGKEIGAIEDHIRVSHSCTFGLAASATPFFSKLNVSSTSMIINRRLS